MEADSEAKERAKELVLIVDNANTHRAEKVKRFLKEVGRITLVFLPSYCPDINPIERLCKWIREKVTHNYLFQTIAELIEAIRDAFHYFANDRERVVSVLGGGLNSKRKFLTLD